jgi:hypothetical protein
LAIIKNKNDVAGNDFEDRLEKMVSYLIETFPESVNLKTDTGYTPLHLAFFQRNLPLAKLLIEAGADVNARDYKGNNLMHILLKGSLFPSQYGGMGSASLDHWKLAKFMELLGEEKCKELLLQRNTSNRTDGGAKTPFHNWIKTIGGSHADCDKCSHCCGMETLNLLLNYGKGEVITVTDGTGDTPVHSVILTPNSNFLRRMLEISPNSLYRENAVGRTPREMASDLYLADKVKEPPGEEEHWNKPQGKKAIRDRTPEYFETGQKKSHRDDIWEICQDHMKKHKVTRTLVSLMEANDVAKRLASAPDADAEASRYHRYRRNRNQDVESAEDFERKDWVKHWISENNGGNVYGVLKNECPEMIDR